MNEIDSELRIHKSLQLIHLAFLGLADLKGKS